MRRFPLLLLFSSLLYLIYSCSTFKNYETKNNDLETISNLESYDSTLKYWKGNPVDPDGRFVNLQRSKSHDFNNIIKYRFSENPQSLEKETDKWMPNYVLKPNFFNDTSDGITWLGHTTFYITLNKKNIITDPIFFNILVVRRFFKFPYDLDLFNNLDYILLSHDHQDHLNYSSFEKLLSVNKKKVKIYAGLRTDELLNDWFSDFDNFSVQTAGWFQKFKVGEDEIEFYFLPAQHWSNRGLGDRNYRLWGSFIIKFKDKIIYFGGDSGKGKHFELVGKLFPDIDFALIGAGAYSPRWFMEQNHTAPEEAVNVFNQMKAKTLLPMHYGTYELSAEPRGEPVRLLRKLEKDNAIKGKLIIPAIGEKVKF